MRMFISFAFGGGGKLFPFFSEMLFWKEIQKQLQGILTFDLKYHTTIMEKGESPYLNDQL